MIIVRPLRAERTALRYTGQAALPDAQLYHYKARVYDPGLGRFLQTDPVGYRDDINLYAYVRNDPINRGDPSGMRVFSGTRQVTPGGWVLVPGPFGFPVPVYVPPQQHTYMATNADYIGDPNATIHSWGPESDDLLNPGALVKRVGDELNRNDRERWIQSNEHTPGIVEIDADDSVADAAANNVIGHPVYQALPDLQPGEGANSNGAEYRAVDDAHRASGRNPNTPTPRPANVPGWDDPVVVRNPNCPRDMSQCQR